MFVPGHLCDERLYAAQVNALSPHYDCQIVVFREERSMATIAQRILAAQPEQFHYVGLSMGGYIAFELLRQQPHRLISLALLDTRATADNRQQRASRRADRQEARALGLAKFSEKLPARWLAPNHVANVALSELTRSMAQGIGMDGFVNQQDAMLGRPDSIADLARVACPSLVAVGRQDPITPISDHQRIVDEIRRHRTDCRFEIIEDCGHLSTIEQPEAISRLLLGWLQS